MAKLDRRLGVIGTGRMGGALIRAWIRAGLVAPDHIIASDVNHQVLDRLKQEVGVRTVNDNGRVVKSSDIVLFALKPGFILPVLREVYDILTKDHLLVSIAAGVPIKVFEKIIGKNRRIIRVMPNTPCLIASGASGFSANQGTTKRDREDVHALLSAVGITIELPENQLDAVTGLSGSGPAFVFILIDAMAEGGMKMGLSQDVAMKLATQTVLGAAQLVRDTKSSPKELKNQVTSPGGTTIAGISVLEQGRFKQTLIEAVEAATKRSVELGRQE